VFHFVLFGMMAQKIGLGQLFIDLATAPTGRFAGGPAKVSVVSSAMLGTISGSSIANTVTTGALTIPAMIRIGFKRHFAAAVEAASSTGGQITPPVMGAMAFLMVEHLGIPLRTILIAAIMPAFMHFFGVLVQVHLEAKRLAIRGLRAEELPKAGKVLREGWLSTVPCWWVWVIGVVTLAGVGFKIAFMVTSVVQNWAVSFHWLLSVLLFELFTIETLSLLFTLTMTAVVCVLMGCGVLTTANYIIMVAAPVLGDDERRAAGRPFLHLILRRPRRRDAPVALAAYAGAGLAGANGFKAGNTAFQLSMGKALVPFVLSPSLLIVTDAFTLPDFLLAFTGAVLGIVALSAAITNWGGPVGDLWQYLAGMRGDGLPAAG